MESVAVSSRENRSSVTLSAQNVREGPSLGLPGTESDLSRCAQMVGGREHSAGRVHEVRASWATQVRATMGARHELAFVISIRPNWNRLGFWNRSPITHARLGCSIGITTTARCGLLRRGTFAVGDSHRRRCARKAGDNLHGRQSQYRERSEPFVHC